METTPPFAPDSASGNHSAGAKVGGVSGVILVLILAIIYVILRRGRCSMNCDVGVNEAWIGFLYEMMEREAVFWYVNEKLQM
ncbi:hypothetical protein SADUNF_Sadunf15G0020000 [Salix dunnii]|uniref:Uncharacterized protein n=1 Tax=Salix dunnii TaxID=1413687 RepID=A0A835JFI0_9ROSI|nr:hypothetical protein SADUNF_Sadunf15G0020000 [Salix dunnii]